MSLSRLLLVAASSKKLIKGQGNDKVIVNPRSTTFASDPYSGEIVLCFQLDDSNARERRVCQSLGIEEGDKRCDGLIFYAQDDQDEKVLCFVEMKSTNIDDAAEQLKSTKIHIARLLREECGSYCNNQLQNIKWKACFYHHGASPNEVTSILRQLKSGGFSSVDNFTVASNNVGPFLRGEESGSAKALAKKVRGKR